LPDNTQQGFNVDAARKAGYSDDEILGHLTSTRAFDVQGALKAGYSKADIISHLSTTAPKATAGPSADQLAASALAKQGIGPVASPGGRLLSPADPYAANPHERDQYSNLEFGALARSAKSADQQTADYLTGRTPGLSPDAAFASASQDANPVLMGPARIAGGVIDYTQSFTNPDPIDAGRAQRYSAGTNVIGGAMQTASPMLPGAAAAAPMRTLSALGLAYGTGYAAKKATAMAGGTPEAQEFADNAASAIPYSQAFGLRGGKIIRGGVASAKVGGAAPLEPVPGQPSAKASAPGEVLSPDTGAEGMTQAPKVVGYQGEALGGSVKGGVTRTPEGTTVAGKVGPYTVSKTFKASNAEPTVTPIGELQHPEVNSVDENIGEFSPKTIANFKKQQARAMYEGDTAAADALAGLLDADAKAKSQGTRSPVPPSQDATVERRQVQRSEASSVLLNQWHNELRAATDPQEITDLKNAIARETDLADRDAASKETSQPEQPTQSAQQLTVKTNTYGDGTHMVSLLDSSGEHRGDLLLEELPNKAGIKINQSEIDTDLIGKGYGTKLYKAAINHAASLGYTKLYSDISPSDQASKVWVRLGAKKVTSKLGVYYSIPTESTQAEPRTKTPSPRDIEGEVPTQGASEPVNEQAPAYTAEQITHRNDFLKYQGQYTQIQKALDNAQAAAKGGFQRGAMNDAQMTWHQAELVRLENKMGDSLRNYARVSPPEHVDQLRAGLQRNLASTKGTADRLGKLLQTDRAAKALRGILPELPADQRKAGRNLLGDLPDTSKMALKQAKFYSPKLKPRVDEAHQQIGDTLSGLVQQYGGDNPTATKYALELKAGLKGEALTDAHLKSIMQIIPPQAKAEVGKLLTILKNETPVVLYHPAIRGTASSQLPEINLRNLQQILGRKLHDKASRQITPEERFANKALATADPMAAKAGRDEMSRTLVKGLQDQANKRAAFLQKQLNSIDKASGAGKRANEKTLESLVNKQKVLSQIPTADLEALVADTKTLHKQFPEMNNMQLAKQHLQGELTKRADADRQQKEILKFKVGQVIAPQPTLKTVAPVSKQLGQARYFADEWYQTPELAAAASVMDSKIAKMSPSVINKYLGPLAKKVAKGDKQSVALLNAYNKRLVELGKPEALPETLLEKQVKNITNPVEAPIGPQVGQLESFRLATGSVITGRVESIEGDKVKIVRPNGSKNVQPLANWVAPKGEQATPPVIESKPIEAQKTEAIKSIPVTKQDLDRIPPGESKFTKGSLEFEENPGDKSQVMLRIPGAGLLPQERVDALTREAAAFAKQKGYKQLLSDALGVSDKEALALQNLGAESYQGGMEHEPLDYVVHLDKLPAKPTGASVVGGSVSPSKQSALNSLSKLPDADLSELAPKLIQFAKDRPDLDADGRNNLITEMAEAALTVPKEKAVSTAYGIARKGAPPLSTWTAETGGSKRKEVQSGFPGTPREPATNKVEIITQEGERIKRQVSDKELARLRNQPDIRIGSVSSMQDIGKIVQPKAPEPVPESPKSSTSPELDAAKKRAVETMQAIEKQAGDLGINRLRAIAKGLDVSMPGKIYALDKALTLYLDGLKVGDPNALARARDFLLAQNGEPNTGRMSLFGLDRGCPAS
jgi:predicted GNAT family acetyltransferase